MAFILLLSEILASISIASSLPKHLLRTVKDLRSLPRLRDIEQECHKTDTVLWVVGEDTSLLCQRQRTLFLYICI